MTYDELMTQAELYSEEEAVGLLRGTLLELSEEAESMVQAMKNKFVGINLTISMELGSLPEVVLETYGVCKQASRKKELN